METTKSRKYYVSFYLAPLHRFHLEGARERDVLPGVKKVL